MQRLDRTVPARHNPSLTLRAGRGVAFVGLSLLLALPALSQQPAPPYPVELHKFEEGPREKLPRQEDDHYVDERHRRMKTRFDPGNRWRLGSAWGATLGLSEQSSQAASVKAAPWQLSHGIDLRGACDFDDEGCWKSRHSLIAFGVSPMEINESGWPVTDLVFYEGEFIRHRKSPHIVVPTIPPRRLLIPFDFGMSVKTAGLHVPATPGWDVEVIDARLLLEFWRSERVGSTLLLGIGTRYDLFVRDGDDPELEHVLSPFTATSLTFRHEWADGRQRLDLSVDSHPFWSSRRGISNALDASARYDITLLAINDQPITLNIRADYRYGDFQVVPGASDHVVQAMAGIELGVE